MRMSPRRLFGVTLLALTTAGLAGGIAAATPDDNNVDAGHAEACVKAGLTGQAIDGKSGKTAGGVETGLALPHEITGGTHLTITGGLDGYTVTGVVVKGSNGYHTYPAGDLGELPWTDLQSPLNPGGQIPDISHWFFCVEQDAPGGDNPGGDTPGEDNPGGDNPGGDNPGEDNPGEDNPGEDNPGEDNPGGDTPGEDTPGEEGVVPTTTPVDTTTAPTTTSAPAAAAGADDLADTGFGSGWLLFAGLGLVAVGAAFVASPKLRGLVRR